MSGSRPSSVARALSIPSRWSWLFCQWAAFRLAEPSRRIENHMLLIFFNRPLCSLIFFPLRPPACRTTASVQLHLPPLLSATTQQQHNGSRGMPRGMCVVAVRQKPEIEPRHVHASNRTIKHRRASYQVYEAYTRGKKKKKTVL